MFRILLLLSCILAPITARAADLASEVEKGTRRLEMRVIETRRDLHQHPELSNRETRTAFVVA